MKKFFFPRMDMAEIFDRYSITEVKYHNAIKKTELSAEMRYLENIIIKGVGRNKFQEIIQSSYYHDLYEANFTVYNSINIAEVDIDGKILSAHQLNNVNKKRTAAKRNLLNKFLNEEIAEIKLDKVGNKL